MRGEKVLLAGELQSARSWTLHLVRGLSDEMARKSVHPDLSPIGWHLGHVAWQQEFWVLRRLWGHAPIDGRLDGIYDSFRGGKSSRSQKLPPLGAILAYAQRVVDEVLACLEGADLHSDDPLLRDGYVFRFLANHERQHTETMGTVALLARIPVPPHEELRATEVRPHEGLGPTVVPPHEGMGPTGVPPHEGLAAIVVPPHEGLAAIVVPPHEGQGASAGRVRHPGSIPGGAFQQGRDHSARRNNERQRERAESEPEPWISIPGGAFEQGGDDPDGWDNERQRHRVELAPYRLSRYPVDNRSWLEFIAAGAYEKATLWSREGWSWRQKTAAQAPLHWEQGRDGGWYRWTLQGLVPVDPLHPVAHISAYEADAFARFAGARLPTESEWERAAGWDAGAQKRSRWPFGDQWTESLPANVGLAIGDTSACGAFPSRSPVGAADMAGNVWEWCASKFEAYPGFRPDPYRGYSEPWFDGAHRVLRGGCWLSWPTMARVGFRNWFEPRVRWFPTGTRLAAR